MEEIAPKLLESGTFCLLRYGRQEAHVRHMQKQDDNGKSG
jgi:hypothetical protein